MGREELVDQIRALIELTRAVASDLVVTLVICVRGRTKNDDDYEPPFSVTASFLKPSEFDDLSDAIESQGIEVNEFYDASSFIKFALSRERAAIPRSKWLVYTSAISGTGPGRRALIPAFCALQKIATVNSDPYACALNRHKYHWTRLLGSLGLPVPKTWMYDPVGGVDGWFHNERPEIGQQVVGKATYEGSSIGLTRETVGDFTEKMELRLAEVSRKLRQPMTVQELISGNEYEVPILEISGRNYGMGAVSIQKPDGRPVGDDVFDYQSVYDDEGYSFQLRADPVTDSKLQSLASEVANAFPFRGFSRIDLRTDVAGRPFVIDVSSTPHLTRKSSFAVLFESLGFSYSEMFLALLGTGIRRHNLV